MVNKTLIKLWMIIKMHLKLTKKTTSNLKILQPTNNGQTQQKEEIIYTNNNVMDKGEFI